MKRLETERLILRDWSLEDVHDFYAYARLDTVGPNAGWKPHQNEAESRKILADFIAKGDTWAVVYKPENRVIGSVGMHAFQDFSGRKIKMLGYVLSTAYEGRGLMTEACKRAIAHVLGDTDCEIIRVSHFLGNDKSRRVIEKCGFRFIKEEDYESIDKGIKRSRVYEMTRKDYQMMEEKRMTTWNLNKLYPSFNDEMFKRDLEHFEQLVDQIQSRHEKFLNYDDKEMKLNQALKETIELMHYADKLFHFASLQAATDSTNQQAVKYMNRLQMKIAEITKVETLFTKWVKDYPDLDKTIKNDPFLQEHEFHLKETQARASHMLDDKTESLISKLKQSGSTAWNRLQSLLTSTVAVDYEGKEITLSEVRNLAYDKDPDIRKNAYFAELAAYQKIDKSIAFAINAIKGEVNTLSEARGFASPLEEALFKSRMQKKTLDVLLDTMEEYLPWFRKYLKRKAKLLGHADGLPFYDLFAPIGNVGKTFTIPEANEYILKNFSTFNKRLPEMAGRAFNEGWVDYLPKKGKVGGAFCANIHAIKESRVLTNFTGAFGDVITLSHELGHAYHGEAIYGESVLNADYTMPVAETASTFCETIVNKAALRDATTDEEKIYLLESSLQDYTQVIVDIMSRFIFEKSVFEGRKQTVFDESELKDLMLDAQKKTYGDGLDEKYLHPYMWVCKSHYYSGELSYYNFPYAFGLLFAKGLYAKYLENKEAFVKMYDDLLAATGKNMVEDAAMIAGIDVTQKSFWKASLELLKEDIELFLKLTE